MILYFKVVNSRSFAKEAILSMIATKDYPDDFSYIIKPFNIKVLKTSLIYGANASGKSNLLKSLADAVTIILKSHMYSKNSENSDDLEFTLKYFPNKNELIKTDQPTHYTLGLLINNRIFEYSFSNNNKRIVSESLIEKYNNEREIVHFIRIYNRKEKKYLYPILSEEYKAKFATLVAFTKKENLFLSISAQLSEDDEYKINISDMIWDFLMNKLSFSINIYAQGKSETMIALELIRKNKKLKPTFLELLKNADFSIIDIRFIVEKDKNGKDSITVRTIHKGLNRKNEIINVEYDLFEEESAGTQQFISWLGYWILSSFHKNTLVIDEFGNSMHPMLTEFLVSLFQQNEGQLIFSTHDVKLMNSKYIEPEQIWIVEKDELANSSISSLSEFDIDKDKMIDNVYLDGIFRGVPNLTF